MRYAPDAATSGAGVPGELIARSAARSRLALPVFTEEEAERLFAAHAPVFEIETGGDHDRFGMPEWERSGAPGVDVAQPVVFRRLAYTRNGSGVLVQLVYTIWFPGRPAASAFYLLSGRLDGVIWRVTLAPDGAPLVYDTIHPCGCYHMFFPTARAEPRPSPEPDIEWAFVPLRLPAVSAGERLVVRIASGDHYVVGVRRDGAGDPGSEAGTRAAQSYRMVDEEVLRTLPLPAGGTRSLYGPDGLVAGTERAERFFFWPMGIPSAGQMRQWGRHATAFVGRRHFDDARLIEQRFLLLPP
jgi:hypothetical protein